MIAGPARRPRPETTIPLRFLGARILKGCCASGDNVVFQTHLAKNREDLAVQQDGQQHPEKDEADLVAKEGDAAGILVESVEVRCGGVVVYECVLGRSALKQLSVAFFGVCVDGGNVVDIGNRKDDEEREVLLERERVFSLLMLLIRAA